MAQIPLGTVSGGGGGGVFSGSVADLFATLGLDATSFSETLQKSKVELNETSKNVLTLLGFLKQLQTQAGPTVAVAAFEQLNAQLSKSTRQLFLWQQQVVPALKEANAVLAGGGAVPPVGGATGGGPISGGGGGAQFLVTRLTERFLIYQGLRFAVQGFTQALHEADDITRRMDQTGWGSEGVQRLQLSVERLHMPVDQVTSAITRFEEKVDSGDLSLIKALDRMGLKFTDVRRQMSADPQAGLESFIGRMNTIQNQGEFADTSFAAFQDRSGKMLGFVREYTRLKEEAEKVPILSEDDRRAIEDLNTFIQHLEQRISVGIGRTLGAKASQSLIQGPMGLTTPEGLPTPSAPGARIGDILLKPSPTAPSPLGGVNAPGGAAESINRILDEFRAPHELAMRKLNEDWQTMLLMERQGLATHSQVIEFSQRASMKLTEEAQAEIDAIIKHDVALLTEFGAQGKRTTELMARDFQELSNAFKQNRISLEEMNEATANYFSMLEENAARPALKEAIRMFEQGLIGPDELLRARERARALTTRTGAETAFEQGLIGPAGLMDAQQRYRRSLQDFSPDRGQRYFLGPGGSILAEPRRDSLPMTRPSDMRGPQGSLNIIPLDQFSDQMLRRWKQQGY